MWKTIHGYDGRYEINDTGEVRSFFSGEWVLLKHKIGKNKYHRVTLYTSHKSKAYLVHRLVLCTFIGPPKVGQESRHLDGNRSNNALSNLQWGTKKENAIDRVMHGNQVRGSAVTLAKLIESDIPIIRTMISIGMTQTRIANLFGVAQSKISAIKTGATWRHV